MFNAQKVELKVKKRSKNKRVEKKLKKMTQE